MRLRLMNAVVLAEDYARLRDWYVDVLGLDLDAEWTEKYHYAELTQGGRLVLGIADAKEMGVEPVPRAERRNAAVVPQFDVEDCRAFLERVKARGGEVPFGPARDEDYGFWFGGFTDPEGNPAWVVESPPARPDPACP